MIIVTIVLFVVFFSSWWIVVNFDINKPSSKKRDYMMLIALAIVLFSIVFSFSPDAFWYQ